LRIGETERRLWKGVRRDEKGDGEIGRDEGKRKVQEKNGRSKGRERKGKAGKTRRSSPSFQIFWLGP